MRTLSGNLNLVPWTWFLDAERASVAAQPATRGGFSSAAFHESGHRRLPSVQARSARGVYAPGTSRRPAKTSRPRGAFGAAKPETEGLALQRAYQAGSRDGTLLEKLSARYAGQRDFAKALAIGLERRAQAFADPQAQLEWDLKVGLWAEQAGELHTALQIYLRDRDPKMPANQRVCFVKPGYEEAFSRIQSGPEPWIEAARRKMAAGDFLEAEALLREADTMNVYALHRRKDLLQPHYNRFVLTYRGGLGSLADEKAFDGTPNVVRLKAGADRDPAIEARIEALRAEIRAAKEGVPERFAQEFEALRGRIRAAKPRELPALLRRLARAEQGLKTLQELETLPIARFNAAPWQLRAQVKLASGFFHEDPADWEEGMKVVGLLKRYVELEKRKQAVFDTFVGLYPEGSSFVFAAEVDPKAKDQNEWQPSAKAVHESQVLKTLRRLEGQTFWFTSIEGPDPALAAYAREMLADLRATVKFEEERESLGLEAYADYFNLKVTGFTEDRDPVDDLAALEAFVAKRERLYAGPEAARFFEKIVEDERKDQMENNEGYRLRRELDEALATLKDFQYNEALFRRLDEFGWVEGDPGQGWFEALPESPGPVALSAKAVEEFPNFILSRGETYRKFLEAEVQRARELDAKEAVVRGEVGQAWKRGFADLLTVGLQAYQAYREGRPVEIEIHEVWRRVRTPRETEAQGRLEAFQKELAGLRSRVASLEGQQDGDTILRGFRELHAVAAGWEEAHTRGLLERELALLKAQGAPAARLEAVVAELKQISDDPWLQGGGERAASFRRIQDRIDHEALRAEIDGRLKAYAAMENEVELSDDIWNGIGDFYTFLPSLIDEDWDWKDRMNQAQPFTVMKRKYRELLEWVDSGDTAQVEAARKKFLRLNSATLHSELFGVYESASSFNQYTVGIGIVVASGLTAGLASAGVAALGGGTLATGFTNAAVFTLSARVYRGAAYDGLSGVGQAFVDIAKDPAGFTEETLLNWAMFKVIGVANHRFHAALASRVEKVVANRMAERGLIAKAGDLTEDLMKADPALRQVALEEAAKLGESFWPEIAKRGGAFATEAATFQGWEFVMGNYANLKQSRFDPLGAAERAFSLHAWIHGVTFLGGLKVGNTLATALPFYRGALGFLQQQVQRRHQSAILEERVEGLRGELYAKFGETLAAQRSFEESFAPDNGLGLKPVEEGLATYPAGRRGRILEVLDGLPWVQDAVLAPNGLIEVSLKYPFNGGGPVIRMYPEGREADGQRN